MNHIITWSASPLYRKTADRVSCDKRYYIKHKNSSSVINITSATEISGAKVFDSHGHAKWIINEIERHTSDLGIIDIIEMTDKELFEARLKGK